MTTQDSYKKLKGIGDESISSLCLCHNKRGELVPLCNLIGYSYIIPTWLSDYQIRKDDYFKELDDFLMAEEDIYSDIIYDCWDDLRFNDIKDFYIDVKRLYDLDAQNNKTLKGKDYVYTENNEFVFTKDLIYNSKMLDDSIDYKSLENVISSIFSGQLPNKQIAALLEEEPFGLPNTNICDWLPLEDVGVTLADIQNILKFSTLNNETFFKVFVIEYRDNEYHITSRTNQHFQVYVGDKATKLYLSERMDEYSSMVLLPYNLRTYKDSEGIVSGLNLCSDILKNVEDVNAEKEKLIDILKGEAQREFLNALSEIRIDLSEDTSVDSYSYKLLRMAADVIKTTEDQKSFRQKLVIVDDGKSFCYDEISQTLSDKVEIEGAKKEFDVARLLPNEYGNGYLLIDLANEYASLGVSKAKLNLLLGITNDTDIEELYDTIISNYKTLLTDQQLAFVLTVCSNNGHKIPSFKLIANNNEEYDGPYVVKPFSFINDSYALSKSYRHLKDYIELPYGNNIYIDSPYIDNYGHFICTGLDTETDDKYDFEKIIALLEYLSKLYRQNKDKFNNVDWSTLKDNLGFNTYECIYPSDFATESEALPEEVEKWIALSPKNKEVIEALGVCTEDNTIIKFRKFLNGDIHEFDNDSLYSADDVESLENSLGWIADKDVFPLTQEKYDALRTTIDRINKLRKKGKIIITDKPDIDKIEKQCEEYEGKGYTEWKEKTGYTIYLYDGNIPHIVEIDEYIEDVVFSYSEGDIADNGEDNIYVNKNADIQQAMHQLAMDNKINLKTEEVYELFNQSIIELEKEIKRLEQETKRLRSQQHVKISGKGPNNLPVDFRPEYNEIARKKVKQRLEREGFRFTQGIGDSSIIEGVLTPDGSSASLVVKSCRTGELFINPNEWGELLMPNAMLWISNGEEVAPLHLRELIMNKQRLVLEIDTSNFDDVDRVSKFAQILRYFKQVHFNFDSVRPTTTARKIEDYAFDDRTTDEEF